MSQQKRKICFVITSFIHYSRNFLILEELKNRDDVELHIVIGGGASVPKYVSKYADAEELLKEKGFDKIYQVHFNLEGSSPITQAKTTGLGIIEFSSIFYNIGPDLVVVRGDRFEGLAAATAALYMNIPIAHLEGGDVSGTVDEAVRHAITKLSHLHFVTNEDSKKRVLQMGERPEYVFNFGSPDVEVVHRLSNSQQDSNEVDLLQTGSGSAVDLGQGFLIVMFHPVSTEFSNMASNTQILLEAVQEIDLPALWFWPNFDAGAEEISHKLRVFKDEAGEHKIRFMRYLPPEKFLTLLKNAKCIIGNSSAGLKESSYLGVPAINIGSRQNNRLAAENVTNVNFDKKEISDALKKQLSVGRYRPSDLYFGSDTSRNIADKLATVDLYIQKQFVN